MIVHYALYLDEFGHVGPYVSRTHPRYHTSPVFGLAGLLLPVEQVREFAIWFYQLKCRLLAWDLEHENPAKRPPYQGEKKGSQLYTVHNVNRYQQLRRATNRLLARIEQAGGYVCYAGIHKTAPPEDLDSAELFRKQLLRAIRNIDQFCGPSGSTFILLLDEQKAGDDWRERNVEACTLAMFEDKEQKCRALIEPPLQAESHLFQTLQCADWICGLVGRLQAHSAEPADYPEWEVFDRYFAQRIARVMLPGSGLDVCA